MELEEKVLDLSEKVARIEKTIESIAEQQVAINALTNSVQEIALSLRDVIGELKSNSARLTCMEEDKKSKKFFVWTAFVGGFIGIAITKFIELFSK